MLPKFNSVSYNLKTVKRVVLIAGVVIAIIAFLVTNTALLK